MSGAAARIAEIGKFNRSYVCRVLSGEKAPSKRFLLATECVLAHLKGQIEIAIVRHEHPELGNVEAPIGGMRLRVRGRKHPGVENK
jgi:hypothetical protein